MLLVAGPRTRGVQGPRTHRLHRIAVVGHVSLRSRNPLHKDPYDLLVDFPLLLTSVQWAGERGRVLGADMKTRAGARVVACHGQRCRRRMEEAAPWTAPAEEWAASGAGSRSDRM